MLLFYFFYIPIFLLAWALMFPEQAVALVENMKRSLVAYVATNIARRELHLLQAQFRKWGRSNRYNPKLIDQVFDNHSSEILRRLEDRYSVVNVEELV